MDEPTTVQAANAGYRVEVWEEGRRVHLRLRDLKAEFDFADGPYLYRAVRPTEEGAIVSEGLVGPTIQAEGDTITVLGRLGGLDLAYRLRLPRDRPLMEERITLWNRTDEMVTLRDFASGMQRLVADKVGTVRDELSADRFVAIPFPRTAGQLPEDPYPCGAIAGPVWRDEGI
jgi:hypothetical protein